MIVYIGIDWSQAKHDVCFLDAGHTGAAFSLARLKWWMKRCLLFHDERYVCHLSARA